jgi:outer membrane protein insertion porin family
MLPVGRRLSSRMFAFRMMMVLALLCAMAFAQDSGVISDIQIHGSRRIPQETIKQRMFSRPGDVYDPAGIERDFMSLWNAGYFDDLRIEREETTKGWIIHVYVKEKPTIRELKYEGLNSVSQSDVLDKFKERKVGLSQESQFDPTKVKKAEVVIKELLAAHGRQFATVRTEIRQIPPASVGVTFNVKEGPKVKVGNIKFEGNKKVDTRYLRASMKNLKPIGLPHSIFLENLFARTYDSSKLEEDTERVRFAFQDKGYFKAIVEDPKTKIRDTSGINWFFPFKKKNGKVVDITIPVEEGDRYKLKEITFTGNKALPNSAALRRIFKIKDGDWFSRTVIGKGLDDLRKAYSSYGYINFTPLPNTEVDEEHKTVSLKIDIDEGKQFYVRRIEFTGNTTTRDKVIRRELALDEGNVYNGQLWEMSLLRLNQLNYFETLKPEQDSEIKRDDQNHSVDINLKVKEKGKNSIGLTGGVSGLAGSFIGINYETNNFLGLGETLSVQASVGSYERNILFGFTEPYLFDRPLQAGFTIYKRSYNYNQAKQASISTGQQLNLPDSLLNSLQNFTQDSVGFTANVSYPIRRSFKRVGLTYSFDNSSIKTFSDASRQYFEFISFRNVSGPNSLEGITTSKLVPSFSFSTIDNPMRPHSGRSFFVSSDIAGLGGNVRMIRPVTEFKQWIPMKGFRPNREGRNTFGFRVQGSFATGYAGRVAPPFERFYQGGDTDLRGFDVRAVSPIAFIPDTVSVTLTNPDQTEVLVDPKNPRRGAVTIPLPIWRIIYPGGDTSIITNAEYRMPIVGPVTLAAFVDTGWNMALRQSQLALSGSQLDKLNSSPYGCSGIDQNTFDCMGATNFNFGKDIKPIAATNYITRMSTGLELQVIMPVVNAPFRVYYAYNPLRMNTTATPPTTITRSMFPAGGAGDYTYLNSVSLYNTAFKLHEPANTFRFTVATTF